MEDNEIYLKRLAEQKQNSQVKDFGTEEFTKEQRQKIEQKQKESLEKLKREIAIMPLAGSMGIKFTKVGSGEFAGLCPFHDDKNPSLHVNVIKNLFHCKGCGKSGSVIDWVMLTKGFNTSEAIRYLRESNMRLDRAFFSLKKTEAEEIEKLDIREPKYQKALRLVVDFFHQNLLNKKEGTDYLLKRGLIYGEIAREYKIGYSDGSLIDAINDEEIIEALFDLGIVWAKGDTLNERFIGHVVFPVIDEEGVILQLYGRNTTNKGSKHLYLRAPLIGLYNQRALISTKIILAECFIDALSLIALGHPNVCASSGINGLNDEALRLFSDRGVQTVYFAFDADQKPEVENAIEKYSEKLMEDKVESFRIEFDPGTDANDLLRNSGQIEEAKAKFAELLENAKPLKQLTDTGGLYETGRTERLEKRGKDHKEYFYQAGKREYIIRGLDQNKTNSALKVFLRLDHESDPPGLSKKFHIDNNLDLFNAKASAAFSKAAATRLTLDERVIRADLDSLTAKLDEILQKLVEERENKNKPKQKEYHQNLAMSQKAKEFLYDPIFITKFVRDIERCGVVGEALNFFFGFLCTLTRYMDYQVHVIFQSESSAGKSTMLNLLSEFVPEEDSIYFTQVTPRSLYYGPPGFLKNKCIFIAETDGLREAEFPIKQMMSEGRLSISYTKTDPKTGEHTSEVKENEGPAQFNFTEPTEGLHEEIENRSAVIVLDVTPQQTERIQKQQRLMHSPEGVNFISIRKILSDFYRHVQRELSPYPIINSYSLYLDYDSQNHQARRDHRKYLSIMNAVTILFQHQREIVTKESRLCLKTHIIDIAITHFLVRRIFTKSLDELPAQTRSFVDKVAKHFIKYAKEREIDFDQIWFYRKDMREITGLSNTRVHEHTSRLVDFEYLTTKRDQNGIAYRFLVDVSSSGSFRGSLKLAYLSDLLKRASKKERQQYKDFIPSLQKIFKALDPSYQEGEEL